MVLKRLYNLILNQKFLMIFFLTQTEKLNTNCFLGQNLLEYISTINVIDSIVTGSTMFYLRVAYIKY